MTHPRFAEDPTHYIRGFNLLVKDLQTLFEYIEPADENGSCYSARTLELLLRSCIEIEANCKAILKDNSYPPALQGKRLDMKNHYSRIEGSHRLSSYEIQLPVWRGKHGFRRPFDAWARNEPLPWYQAYNEAKHDRHESFAQATFDHAVEAVSGVAALLSAQFWTEDFSGHGCLLLEGPGDSFETAIGGYFRVRFPGDWPEDQRYEFDWQQLKHEEDPFRDFDYVGDRT